MQTGKISRYKRRYVKPVMTRLIFSSFMSALALATVVLRSLIGRHGPPYKRLTWRVQMLKRRGVSGGRTLAACSLTAAVAASSSRGFRGSRGKGSVACRTVERPPSKLERRLSPFWRLGTWSLGSSATCSSIRQRDERFIEFGGSDTSADVRLHI